MTEFYMNCSEKQIADIVNEKIKIYADFNIEILKCSFYTFCIYKYVKTLKTLDNVIKYLNGMRMH